MLRFTRIVYALSVLLAGSSALAISIHGMVTDTSHAPLKGATVQIVRDEPPNALQRDPIAETTTSQSGEFVLDTPDTASISLLAFSPEHRRTRFPVVPSEASKRKLGLALEPGAIIAGTVTDTNGAPIAGALIGPLAPAIDAELEVAAKSVPQWTRSDSTGKFVFRGVMRGLAYHFISQAPGFQITDTSAQPDQKNLTVRMKRGGTPVAGRVYSRRQPDGIGGAIVRLNGLGFDVFARTDSAGQFKIVGVPAGTFSLESAGQSPFASRVLNLEMPRDASSNFDVEVSAGYYVEGDVVDAGTSTPAADVTLSINNVLTTSAANGHFRVGPLGREGELTISLPPGSDCRLGSDSDARNQPTANGFDDLLGLVVRVHRRYPVKVNIENFAVTTQPVTLHLLAPQRPEQRLQITTESAEMSVFAEGDYLLYGQSGGLSSNITTATVGRNGQNCVTIRMAEAASLPGRVTMLGTQESTSPRVFSVRLMTGTEPTSTVLVSELYTKKDGSFLFPQLPTGRYFADVANATQTRTARSYRELSSGSNTPLNIEFAAGHTLSGVVRDQDSRSLPEARVQFYTRRLAQPSLSGSVVSGNDGKFVAADLDAESLDVLKVDLPGFLPYQRKDLPLPSTNMAIVLSRPAPLTAVVDAPDNTDWRIFLLQSEPWRAGNYADQLMSRSVLDRNAKGGAPVPLPVNSDGRYRLAAVDANRAITISDVFEWKTLDQTPTTVTLSPGATGRLTGTVTGSSDLSVEVVATNTAIPEGFAQAEFQTASANGHFDFPQLPAGDYLVQATGQSYSAAASNVDVKPNATATVNLTPATLASVTGKVVLNSQPLPGATIELISQTDPTAPQHKAVSGADGSFRIDGIGADSWLIRADVTRGTENLHGEKPVTVARNGSPEPVTLDLAPLPHMTFTIPGVSPGTAIVLSNPGEGVMVNATWKDGKLQAPVHPGTYDVARGDEPIGKLTIAADGSASFK